MSFHFIYIQDIFLKKIIQSQDNIDYRYIISTHPWLTQ